MAVFTSIMEFFLQHKFHCLHLQACANFRGVYGFEEFTVHIIEQSVFQQVMLNYIAITMAKTQICYGLFNTADLCHCHGGKRYDKDLDI